MFEENIINLTFCIIIKMPALRFRQIQCRKDKMQVSYVEKNMLEQPSTVHNSQTIRST